MQAFRSTHVALLTVMVLLLSSSFAAIKVALEGLTPWQLVAVRLWVAALVLSPWLLSRRREAPPVTAKLVAVGLLSTAIPFALLAWAELHVEAGRAGVLFAVGPLVAGALLSLLRQADRPSPRQWGALAIGSAGIAVALPFSDIATSTSAGLVLLAVFAYALGGVLLPSVVCGVRPVRACAHAALWGAGLAGLAALVEGAPVTLSWQAIGAAVWLGLGPTALAFLIRYRLTLTVGYGFVSWAGYFVPVLALVWAAALVGERPRPSWLLGLAAILIGLRINWRARETPSTTDATPVRPPALH